MLNDLRKVEGKVRDILETVYEARDNDMILFLVYLNRYHGLRRRLEENVKPEPYLELKRIVLDEAPKFESISRARRKIQEYGDNLGDRQLGKKKEEKKVRQYFREAK